MGEDGEVGEGEGGGEVGVGFTDEGAPGEVATMAAVEVAIMAEVVGIEVAWEVVVASEEEGLTATGENIAAACVCVI